MIASIPNEVLFAEQIQGDREYQEDDFAVAIVHEAAGSIILLALADGLGGHVAGAIASELAVKNAISTFEASKGEIDKRLYQALIAANKSIENKVAEYPKLNGMGTTLVLAAITNGCLQWVSVGDSPLWLISKSGISRLNEDHSMKSVYEDMIAMGRMTREEFEQTNGKNALRSALSGDEIELIDIVDKPLVLLGDEIILLASDGLETLTHVDIAGIAHENMSNMKKLGAELMDKVIAANRVGQDNTTLIAYRSFRGTYV